MSERRVPGLRFAVLLPILALAAALLMVGCVKKESAGAGGRLTLGGEEAGELEEEEAAPGETAAPAAPRPAAEGTPPAVAPGGMGAGPAGPGPTQFGAARSARARQGAAAMPPGPPPISETEAAAKVHDFAALYGPVTRVEEKNWDGRLLQWVSFTYDGENLKLKGRRFKLPLSMVVDAPYPEVLEGYFPIYSAAGRLSGKTVSTQTITAPRRPRRPPEEIKKIPAKARPAAAAGAAETAAAGPPGAARGGGMGGRGAGGGRGFGGGPRGGRFGGGPRGGF